MNTISRSGRTETPKVKKGMPNALRQALAIAGLCAAAASVGMAAARADELAEVQKLFKAGQYPQALARADAALAQKPKDAQMRFLKGVALAEMNRPNDAIALFVKLTEDFPDLPEPYNNLAVLYAANGQYDKARAALDNAIRTNPSYATAYENLGDVHAKLASQAYDKALQLDSRNSTAKSKLTLLLNIGTATAKAVPAPQPAAPLPAIAAKAAPTPAPGAPGAAGMPAVPTGKTQVAAAPAPAVPSSPAAAAAKPAPAPSVAAAKPAPAAAASREDDDVMKVVNGWARAWSSRDVKAYLDYYANDFQTPGGVSRKAWADERTARIQGKGRISVSIETPKVTVNGNTATVTFRQVYVSDRLKANSRKTLVLARQGKNWVIKQEQTGN